MTFTESIQTCFKKWRTVKGTASRSEFWFFSLFIALVAIPLVILFLVTAGNTGYHSSGSAGLLVFGVPPPIKSIISESLHFIPNRPQFLSDFPF